MMGLGFSAVALCPPSGSTSSADVIVPYGVAATGDAAAVAEGTSGSPTAQMPCAPLPGVDHHARHPSGSGTTDDDSNGHLYGAGDSSVSSNDGGGGGGGGGAAAMTASRHFNATHPSTASSTYNAHFSGHAWPRHRQQRVAGHVSPTAMLPSSSAASSFPNGEGPSSSGPTLQEAMAFAQAAAAEGGLVAYDNISVPTPKVGSPSCPAGGSTSHFTTVDSRHLGSPSQRLLPAVVGGSPAATASNDRIADSMSFSSRVHSPRNGLPTAMRSQQTPNNSNNNNNMGNLSSPLQGGGGGASDKGGERLLVPVLDAFPGGSSSRHSDPTHATGPETPLVLDRGATSLSGRVETEASTLAANMSSFMELEEKAPAGEIDALREAVADHALFCSLEPTQMEALVHTFVRRDYGKGDVIVAEGEPAMGCLVIVMAGNVAVTRKGSAMRTLARGSVCGEMEMAYPVEVSPTTLTVTSPTATLYTLNKDDYKKLVLYENDARRLLFTQYLDRVPLLKTLAPVVKARLAEGLRVCRVKEGAVLQTQGEPVQWLYLILSGGVEATYDPRRVAESNRALRVAEMASMAGGDSPGLGGSFAAVPSPRSTEEDTTRLAATEGRAAFNVMKNSHLAVPQRRGGRARSSSSDNNSPSLNVSLKNEPLDPATSSPAPTNATTTTTATTTPVTEEDVAGHVVCTRRAGELVGEAEFVFMCPGMVNARVVNGPLRAARISRLNFDVIMSGSSRDALKYFLVTDPAYRYFNHVAPEEVKRTMRNAAINGAIAHKRAYLQQQQQQQLQQRQQRQQLRQSSANAASLAGSGVAEANFDREARRSFRSTRGRRSTADHGPDNGSLLDVYMTGNGGGGGGGGGGGSSTKRRQRRGTFPQGGLSTGTATPFDQSSYLLPPTYGPPGGSSSSRRRRGSMRGASSDNVPGTTLLASSNASAYPHRSGSQLTTLPQMQLATAKSSDNVMLNLTGNGEPRSADRGKTGGGARRTRRPSSGVGSSRWNHISADGEIIYSGSRNLYRFPAQALKTNNSILIAVVVDGTIIRWNITAQRVVGFAPYEVVGQSIYDLLDSEESRRLLRAMLQTAKGYAGNWEAYTAQELDRQEVYSFRQSTGFAQIGLALSVIPSFFASSSDVFLLIGREAKYRAAASYAADVARWLNTALKPQLQYFHRSVEEIEANGWAVTPQDALRLRGHLDACSSLVSQFARFSLMNMETVNESWRPVRLPVLLRRFLSEVNALVRGTNHTFFCNIDDVTPTYEIFLDAQQVFQVLRLLLRDAVSVADFDPEVAVNIELRVQVVEPEEPAQDGRGVQSPASARFGTPKPPIGAGGSIVASGTTGGGAAATATGGGGPQHYFSPLHVVHDAKEMGAAATTGGAAAAAAGATGGGGGSASAGDGEAPSSATDAASGVQRQTIDLSPTSLRRVRFEMRDNGPSIDSLRSPDFKDYYDSCDGSGVASAAQHSPTSPVAAKSASGHLSSSVRGAGSSPAAAQPPPMAPFNSPVTNSAPSFPQTPNTADNASQTIASPITVVPPSPGGGDGDGQQPQGAEEKPPLPWRPHRGGQFAEVERIVTAMGGMLYGFTRPEVEGNMVRVELPLLAVPGGHDGDENAASGGGMETDLSEAANGPLLTAASRSFTVIVADNERAHQNALCQILWARQHAVVPVTSFKELMRKIEGSSADILIIDPLMLDVTPEDYETLQSDNPFDDIREASGRMVLVVMGTNFSDWRVQKLLDRNSVIELPRLGSAVLVHIAMQEAEQLVAEMRGEEERIELLRRTFTCPVAGRHKVGRLLGKGTFGDVYEVEDTLTGGKMAMKRMQLHGHAYADEVVEEILAMTRLQHENIIHYFYCEKESDTLLRLYMELAPGGTLRNKIRQNPGVPLPFEQIVQHLTDICRGLAYVHAQHFVHGDLKTANLLLGTRGRTKIGDFGTAKQLRPGQKLYTMVGTPQYMAPEVLNADAEQKVGYDFKADIWSVGCIALEMATGQPPFAHLEQAHGMGIIKYLSELTETPDLSPLFHGNPLVFEFVKGCLDVDPDNRPSAQDLFQFDILQGAVTSIRAERIVKRAEMLYKLNKYAAMRADPDDPRGFDGADDEDEEDDEEDDLYDGDDDFLGYDEYGAHYSSTGDEEYDDEEGEEDEEYTESSSGVDGGPSAASTPRGRHSGGRRHRPSAVANSGSGPTTSGTDSGPSTRRKGGTAAAMAAMAATRSSASRTDASGKSTLALRTTASRSVPGGGGGGDRLRSSGNNDDGDDDTVVSSCSSSNYTDDKDSDSGEGQPHDHHHHHHHHHRRRSSNSDSDSDGGGGGEVGTDSSDSLCDARCKARHRRAKRAENAFFSSSEEESDSDSDGGAAAGGSSS